MEHRVITNRIKDAKKYWITFVSVLLGMAFVIAVFSLVFTRDKKYWLSSSNGIGRESLYPYVFTDDGDLFVVLNDKTVYPIDNNCENPVFDAEFERVYYTTNGDLFEYDINKNSRKLLCSGVEKFWIFEERTDILLLCEDDNIGKYSYNSKKVKDIRVTIEDEDEDNETEIKIEKAILPEPVCGKKMFVYPEQDMDEGNIYLKFETLEGLNGVVSDNLNIEKPFYIWDGDAAISYYEGDNLCVYNCKTEATETFENAEMVLPTVNEPAENARNVARIYDGCENIRYIVKDGALCYLSALRNGTKVTEVENNIEDIVAFDEENDVVIYRVPEEENFGIFVSHKGGKGRKVLSANEFTRFMYEGNAGHLYYIDGKDNLFFVDVNDIQLIAYPVCSDCDTVFDYDRKPFAVSLSSDGLTKTIVLTENDIRIYSADESRLYGISDSKYLSLRKTGRKTSLDIVDGDQITRICSELSQGVSFDKKLESVIYVSNGKMYVYEKGQSLEIGEFDGEIKEVPILAK